LPALSIIEVSGFHNSKLNTKNSKLSSPFVSFVLFVVNNWFLRAGACPP